MNETVATPSTLPTLTTYKDLSKFSDGTYFLENRGCLFVIRNVEHTKDPSDKLVLPLPEGEVLTITLAIGDQKIEVNNLNNVRRII